MNNRKRLLRKANKRVHSSDKHWRHRGCTYTVETGKRYKVSFSVKGDPVNMGCISGILVKGYEEGKKYENKR